MGIVVSPGLRESLSPRRRDKLAKWPASRNVFFKRDGTLFDVGERWRQPDLAATLELISEEGPSAFYTGEIAEKLARDMEKHGGLITRDDLASYRPIMRDPVRGNYRGYEIVSMPPPSSGGVHLIQMLNVLEGFDIAGMGHNSAASIHVMTEGYEVRLCRQELVPRRSRVLEGAGRRIDFKVLCDEHPTANRSR